MDSNPPAQPDVKPILVKVRTAAQLLDMTPGALYTWLSRNRGRLVEAGVVLRRGRTVMLNWARLMEVLNQDSPEQVPLRREQR